MEGLKLFWCISNSGKIWIKPSFNRILSLFPKCQKMAMLSAIPESCENLYPIPPNDNVFTSQVDSPSVVLVPSLLSRNSHLHLSGKSHKSNSRGQLLSPLNLRLEFDCWAGERNRGEPMEGMALGRWRGRERTSVLRGLIGNICIRGRRTAGIRGRV